MGLPLLGRVRCVGAGGRRNEPPGSKRRRKAIARVPSASTGATDFKDNGTGAAANRHVTGLLGLSTSLEGESGRGGGAEESARVAAVGSPSAGKSSPRYSSGPRALKGKLLAAAADAAKGNSLRRSYRPPTPRPPFLFLFLCSYSNSDSRFFSSRVNPACVFLFFPLLRFSSLRSDFPFSSN